MTQEEKQQLWECICEMVPHDTIVHHLKVNLDYKLNGVLNNTLPITGEKEQLIYLKTLNNDFQMVPTGPKDVRLYLRPLSSMTKKEQRYIWDKYGPCFLVADFEDAGDVSELFNYCQMNISRAPSFVDWLNEHHFDYRGLIEKGLALEAPEDMYKTE